MTSRLQISATLPSDQQWFAKGAAGEGAFTIPVCDVGTNTEWMDKGMPCCCGKFSLFYSFLPSLAWKVRVDWGLVLGIGCDDTKYFMESANMGNYNPVKKECEKICPECTAVDYGSDTSSLSKPSWRVLAGMFFAIVVAHFLLA